MVDGALQPPSPTLPEEEHFEIALALDESDRKLFEREYATRRAGWRGLLFALAGFVIIGAAAVYFGPMLGRSISIDAPELVAVLVFGSAYIAFTSVSRSVSVQLGWRAVPVDTDGWLLIATVDGLWLRSARDAGVYPWANFKDMMVSEQAIYLGLEPARAIMLPARVVGDRNDFYTFVSVMAKYAGV